MEFTNLMLLYTVPLYWEPRPTEHPVCLQEFLKFLLDPGKPGTAALGILRSSRRACDWVSGQNALQWVDDTFSEVWAPSGELLKQYGKAIGEQVFHTFVEHRAEVFMDKARFEACVGSRREHVVALEALSLLYGESDTEFYVGFSVDWAFLNDSLLWAPQMRLSNFWPTSPRLAPPPRQVVPPRSLSAEEAGKLLEDLFWKRTETLFRALRMSFDLGEAGVKLSDRQFHPPVFYYAEPTPMPLDHDDYVQSPSYLVPISDLCRVVLGTDDPQSADVSGAFLEGNLFTLRREVVRERAYQAYYLLIPWWQEDSEEQREEVERELLSVADKLAYVEFAAGYESYDILTDLAMPSTSMALWGGTLDTASILKTSLQNVVAYEPARSERKKTAFSLVTQLRTLLARMELQVLHVTDEVLLTKRRWEAAVEGTMHFAEQALTSQPILGILHLLEDIRQFHPYRVSGLMAHHRAERAEQLRRTYDGVEQAINDLLYQEQQEARQQEEIDREEQRKWREAQREQEERRQQTLNYFLALLAAVSAFPILIGQMGWSELQQVLSLWWIGKVLQAAHPYLAPIAVLTAGAGIVSLLVVLARSAVQARRLSRVQQVVAQRRHASAERDEVWRELGSQIVQVWQGVDRAKETINQLRHEAFVSHSSTLAAEELLRLRRQVDEWDREACETLIRVWEWLQQTKQQDEPEDNLEWLKQRIQQFIVLTELLDQRPVPFPLPVALCLFRYRSTDFVEHSVVSDFEFEQILNGYGFEDSEVAAIDQWVEQPLSQVPGFHEHPLATQKARLRDLPIKEFAEAMRSLGVTALDEKKITPPAGSSRLPGAEPMVEAFRRLVEGIGQHLAGHEQAGQGEPFAGMQEVASVSQHLMNDPTFADLKRLIEKFSDKKPRGEEQGESPTEEEEDENTGDEEEGSPAPEA